MGDRKLATIRQITELLPIEGADFIEVAVVDGWQCIVKKGEFNLEYASKCVYFEIDSFIPTEMAPFLTPVDRHPKEYMGVRGERLRTCKKKGVLSQGLVLDPYKIFSHDYANTVEIGTDVTEKLNINLFEPPIAACLAGQVKGSFPSFLVKTDQERLQNLKNYFEKHPDLEFEVSEKLDGSSCTIYNFNEEFGVCSRNLELKEDENNSFWKIINKYKLKEILKELNLNIAIQGELIGEGIQGNKYKLKGQDLRVFDIYNIDEKRYLTSDERLEVLGKINTCTYGHEAAILLGYEECHTLQHVPLLGTLKLKDFTLETLLTFADGASQLLNTPREGIVCKSKELVNRQTISFKCLSNYYLLKEKD